MKGIIPAAFLIAAASVLAACGGSGGRAPTPNPGPSSTLPPTSTNAVGTLVDDPSGAPLSNEKVQLDPWIVYATPGPTPTPVFTTTTDATGHFNINAANGTYLLVIGSDDPTDTTRPTIHDKVVLSGQMVLAARMMPPVPGITPAPVETNGDYRLVTIDQTHEIPCITDYDQQRTSRGLPKPVIDEWLTENVRAWVNQSVTRYNKQTDPRNPFGFLTTGNDAVTGYSDCGPMATNSFTGTGVAYATISPWYAGSYLPYQGGSPYSAYGASEFPQDPRLFKDPNAVPWP